jgi:hypothetical protein
MVILKTIFRMVLDLIEFLEMKEIGFKIARKKLKTERKNVQIQRKNIQNTTLLKIKK